jgi:hypothetical protein
VLRTPLAWDVEGGSLRAAPAPTGAKLANTGLIAPLLHGDSIVGLSGLYAITNAIRLAVADRRQLNAGEVYKLMSAGFEFLSGRVTPRQAFQSGCRMSTWRAMGHAMIEVARTRLGLNLGLDRVIVENGRSTQAAFAAIENAIANWRPVLMLCRGGRYTVVSGFTSSSLLLFDSGCAWWIAKRACGVPGDGESAAHMLYPASFMALSA